MEDKRSIRVEVALLEPIERARQLSRLPGGWHGAEATQALGDTTFALPDGVTVIGFQPGSLVHDVVLGGREVSAICIRNQQRRLDLGWSQTTRDRRWLALLGNEAMEFRQRLETRRGEDVFVAFVDPLVEGRDGEVAVRSHGGSLYLFSDSPLAQYLQRTRLASLNLEELEDALAATPVRTFDTWAWSRRISFD